MNTLLIITVLVVIFALAFDFINGFHDTANAIATSGIDVLNIFF